MNARESQHESRVRLLDAALHVIRARGYSATRIEDVCAAARLTKGSFFHHFKSKEDLALAAAARFATMADALFAAAPYRMATDPLDRLLGYVDFRISILQGSLPDFTCLLGTMVQEAFDSHPDIRAACNTHITAHAAMLAQDIAEAKRRYAPDAPWSAESLALHAQAVIQGAFILAKARQGPQVAVECLRHLRRYLDTQFTRTSTQESSSWLSSKKSPHSSGSTTRPRKRSITTLRSSRTRGS
jgi:TetR/AcrR family transcriptional repressor of nem operon